MKTSFDINCIDSKQLDQYRLMADPVADNTISKIISSNLEKQINQVMMLMFRNDAFEKGMFVSLGPDLSQILDEYIVSTSQLPAWADAKKIKSGEKLFSLYGPEIFMLLNVSSLPLCYTCAKGARVLYDTGRLLSHNNDIDPLARRLMETAQMVVNVLSEGGLSEGGKGIVTTQKVRLIHASIRFYLKQGQYNDKKWDVAQFGEPINQEDLTGTLMSFGPVILSGLKKLNVELTDKETDDYMHCWKVVGHLMGIEPQLLPDTYQDGFDLASKILTHQADPSEAGEALTNSCVQFMNYLIPGNALNEVPSFMMDYFLEDFSNASGVNLSKCIGVEGRATKKDKVILSITKFMVGKISHLEEHKQVQKISAYFNKKLLEGIIHHYNDGKGVQFFIPPSLQQDWGLVNQWDDSKATPAILGHRLALQKRKEIIGKSITE